MGESTDICQVVVLIDGLYYFKNISVALFGLVSLLLKMFSIFPWSFIYIRCIYAEDLFLQPGLVTLHFSLLV